MQERSWAWAGAIGQPLYMKVSERCYLAIDEQVKNLKEPRAGASEVWGAWPNASGSYRRLC